MERCKFEFDCGPAWEGFSHGSTWNNFDNVAVTKDTLEKIIAWFEADGCDADTTDSFRSIEPMEAGLYSLGWGFATRIVASDPGVDDLERALVGWTPTRIVKEE